MTQSILFEKGDRVQIVLDPVDVAFKKFNGRVGSYIRTDSRLNNGYVLLDGEDEEEYFDLSCFREVINSELPLLSLHTYKDQYEKQVEEYSKSLKKAEDNLRLTVEAIKKAKVSSYTEEEVLQLLEHAARWGIDYAFGFQTLPEASRKEKSIDIAKKQLEYYKLKYKKK